MTADSAYIDQLNAAVDETSNILEDSGTQGCKTQTFKRDAVWPDLLTKTVGRLEPDRMIPCEHLQNSGPQPIVVYLSHSVYLYCLNCHADGDALAIRQAEIKFQEHCYYCGHKTKSFQSFGWQHGPVLFIGDACKGCAREAGVYD